MIIRNNEVRIRHIGGIRLLPGMNPTVNDEAWANEKAADKVILPWLMERIIGRVPEIILEEVLVESVVPKAAPPLAPLVKAAPGSDEATVPAPPPPPAPFDLSDVSAKDALPLVKSTFDVALLRKWAESEFRISVQAAIEKQLKAIEDEVKKKPAADGSTDEELAPVDG